MTHDLTVRPAARRCPSALLLLVASLAGLATGSTLAATAAASGDGRPANSITPAGSSSAAAGEQLTSEGTAQGGNACMACHGPKGEGNAAGGVPRLAGLPAEYLEKQLRDFTTAARPSAVMSAIAQSLTAAQRQQAARYYAMLPGPTPLATATADRAGTPLARGRTLVEEGDNRLRVQACGNCHGPGATGVAGTATPFLAGQQASYLRNALAAWREGKRNNDPSQQMPTIARRLSAEDVDALLHYLEAAP